MRLRDYQESSLDSLRAGLREGRRSQILVLPTGGGKSLCAAHLLRSAQAKGSRAAFVVDRISLLDQISATLDRYDIDHGVIQAGHWRRRHSELIQVCSAQTLEKRGFMPDMRLLIIDECHVVRKQTAQFIASSRIPVVGLTATPFTSGLHEIYQGVVNVTTTDRLIAEKHLAPLKVYACVAADMAGAKTVAGEWAASEAAKRGTTIIGDIVAEWTAKTHEHFKGPAKTLVFSATVAHGAELCRQFQQAGYNFQQLSYKDSDADAQRAIIEEFRKPDSAIVGLISCEMLGRGFDVPDVMIGVSARPYRKSLSAHIQQLGRVMRAAPGKDYGLWLCHSGNAIRFYDDVATIFEHGVQALDDADLERKPRKEPTEKEIAERKCGACGYVLPPGAALCPACGHARPVRKSQVEAEAGIMRELGTPDSIAQHQKDRYFMDRDQVWRHLCYYALEKKRGDYRAAERFAMAQYRAIYSDWPMRTMAHTAAEPYPALLARRIRQNLIRHFNRTQR